MTRGSDIAAIYRSDTTVDGEVDITNISWHMPQIRMTAEYLTGMRSIIEQKATLPLAFRARTCEQTEVTQTPHFTWRLSVTGGVEKPRWIIIAFQTEKLTLNYRILQSSII